MEQAVTITGDPFLAALCELSSTHLLLSNIAEALLRLPPQTFDAWRAHQEPLPQLTTIDGQRGYVAGDLVQYVEQEPTRRGPIRIRHASFPDFLINGLPDDLWIFGMVLLDFHGQRRPVDVLTCIDLAVEQLWSAICQQMTLAEYVMTIDGYLSRFNEQQKAEALAIKRAGLALSQPPRMASGILRKGRSAHQGPRSRPRY